MEPRDTFEQPKPRNMHQLAELQVLTVRDGVHLRPMKAEDANGILEILDADPLIRDRVAVASKMHSPEDVANQVEIYQKEPHLIRYTLLEDNRPIGLLSFWRDIDSPFNSPDKPNDYGFGYFLDPAERGKGLITNAVQRVMDAAKDVLRVENFIAYCEDNNPESAAVLTRLGFEPTYITYDELNNGWVERKYVRSVI